MPAAVSQRPPATSPRLVEAAQIVAVVGDQTILAGFSDIEAAISYDGGQSWSFNYTGLGQNSLYHSVVHPDTGTLYAVTSTVHDLYETTRVADSLLDAGRGKVVMSTDNGSTWQTMHDFGRIVRWVELDPANPNRMYVSLVHSTDGGSPTGLQFKQKIVFLGDGFF